MNLIHKELHYRIRGVMFDIYNTLGPNLPEKYYQTAAEIGLEFENIHFESEKVFSVYYRGVEVGRYYVDMWIENGKMILEFKVAPKITALHKAQAISYLKISDAELAVLVNFGEASLVDERLPNFVTDKEIDFKWQSQAQSLDYLYPELVDNILAVLHRVHFECGPGFLHQVYRRATMVELRQQSLGYTYIKETPIYYKDVFIGKQPTRLILVEDKILVATIAVQTLTDVMQAELKSRMKHHRVKLGVLANFNKTKLEFMIVR